jgi:sulfur-oxidizing protein SoxX
MKFRPLTTAASVVAIVASFSVPITVQADDVAELVAKGKSVSFNRQKGNCLTCHMIPGGESPGNIGPPLIAMKARFPDKQILRDQIWDSTKKNPATMMPPFGKHNILTEDEIDAVVEYIYTL